VGVLQAGVHSLAADRGVHVPSIASQKDRSLAGCCGDAVVHPVAGRTNPPPCKSARGQHGPPQEPPPGRYRLAVPGPPAGCDRPGQEGRRRRTWRRRTGRPSICPAARARHAGPQPRRWRRRSRPRTGYPARDARPTGPRRHRCTSAPGHGPVRRVRRAARRPRLGSGRRHRPGRPAGAARARRCPPPPPQFPEPAPALIRPGSSIRDRLRSQRAGLRSRSQNRSWCRSGRDPSLGRHRSRIASRPGRTPAPSRS